MLNKLLHLFLSRWFFTAYFSLGLVYFVISLSSGATTSLAQASFATLGLMTGSDPYSLKEVIGPNVAILTIAFLIHIGSWLLIPALVGLLVNDAAQGIKSQQRLQVGLGSFLQAAAQAAGIKDADLPEFTAKFGKLLDELVANSHREEANK